MIDKPSISDDIRSHLRAKPSGCLSPPIRSIHGLDLPAGVASHASASKRSFAVSASSSETSACRRSVSSFQCSRSVSSLALSSSEVTRFRDQRYDPPTRPSPPAGPLPAQMIQRHVDASRSASECLVDLQVSRNRRMSQRFSMDSTRVLADTMPPTPRRVRCTPTSSARNRDTAPARHPAASGDRRWG